MEALWALDFERRKDEEIVLLKHRIQMYEEQKVCEMEVVTASVENAIDERQMLVTASVENQIEASLNNRHQTDSQQKGSVVEDWAGVVAALKLELEDQKFVALALQEKSEP